VPPIHYAALWYDKPLPEVLLDDNHLGGKVKVNAKGGYLGAH
jgi:hypothetical protein